MECIRFVPHQSGYLLGFADFYLPDLGYELKGCTLFQKEGQRWINFPGKEYIKDGVKKTTPFIWYRDREKREEFMNKAKAAIDKFCQENQEEPQIDPNRVPF